MLSEIYSGNKERKDNKVAQIIWDGNKNWENVWDGNQPWDREIAKKSIPEKAVLIDRPDDIIRVYWKSIICHENQPIAKEID